MPGIEGNRIETITTPGVILRKDFDKDIENARNEIRKGVDLLLLLLGSNNEKPN